MSGSRSELLHRLKPASPRDASVSSAAAYRPDWATCGSRPISRTCPRAEDTELALPIGSDTASLRGLERHLRVASDVLDFAGKASVRTTSLDRVNLRPLLYRTATTCLAAPGFQTFPDGHPGDDQPDQRVGPRPAKGGAEHKASEQHGGQVGAQQRLLGIRDNAARLKGPAGSPLCPQEQPTATWSTSSVCQGRNGASGRAATPER